MINSPIPYSTQFVDLSDVDAVKKVLRSKWIAQGKVAEQLEKKVARYVKAKYAVVVTNGTAALHAACAVAGIGPGDEVLVPVLSFVASANCVLYCGATPILVDVYDDTLTIDVEKAEKKISKKTRAIVAVDFAGHPAEWGKLIKIAKKYNLVLIDDAAHAIGSKYRNRPIGSIADLTTFSFHPVKTITTGEGGAIVTNNRTYFEKLTKFRNHGMVKNESTSRVGKWFYEIDSIGFNFRMTDIQAALGLSQFEKIGQFISKRRKVWNVYNKALGKMKGIRLPVEKDNYFSAWHLYTLRIDEKVLGITRRELFEKFQKKDIGVQVHYIPIHLHKLYKQKFGYKRGDFPIAEKYYSEAISLPLYPSLSILNQHKVINLIKGA